MPAVTHRALAILLVVAASSASAQTIPANALPSPALVTAASGESVFRSVSSPEVIATPVNQSRDYPAPAPSREYNDGYESNTLMDPWPAKLLEALKCCPGDTRGRRCRVDRYLSKPVGIDPDCLICVKEPYYITVPVTEQAEVVIYQCFETEVPFEDDGCEDGTWYKKQGKKMIRRLRPCTVTVDLNYKKQVIRYRDVWCHIRCD